MAIQTIATLKSYFNTGDIPTEAQFIDVFDTLFAQSPLTTKGDIVAYSTLNDRLAVGTNGQVLTADSTAATGIKWATPASSGITIGTTTITGGATTQLLFNLAGVVSSSSGLTYASGLFTVLGTTQQAKFAYDASNHLGITIDSSGSATFALTGTNPKFNFVKPFNLTLGTLPTTVHGLYLSATLANTASQETGVSFQITGAGSGAIISGMKVSLLAGYGGNFSTFGIYAQNQSAGTSTDEFNAAQAANYGEYVATTTGYIVGQAGYAAGGNRSYGGMFRAIASKNGATNIGVAGYALNTGSSPTLVGGYFALINSGPTFVSAALIANNGAISAPIFIAQDNGTEVFSIQDGGNVNIANGKNLVFGTSTGTQIGSSSSQKLAFWGKTPIVQPTTAIARTVHTSVGGTVINDNDTFGGYTLDQAITALINCGILA